MEICCGSVEDAVIAQNSGADRIELNSALFLGGLTPSLGCFLAAREKLNIPVMVMIRPREAGFCYSPYELEAMRRDAALFLENGADGLVFGFLHADGTLDTELMREFTQLCKTHGKEAVCHRAFDVVPNPFEALAALISLGVNRLLTSGQAPAAPEGAELIRELIQRAECKIEILPGGGLNARNLERFVALTGAEQVHFSARRAVLETSTQHNAAIHFGGALYPREDVVATADGGAIGAMGALLRGQTGI